MRELRVGLTGALCLLAGPAGAHAFDLNVPAYAAFVEGTFLTLRMPELLFCLLPLGVLAGLWRDRGFPALWPALTAGLVMGCVASPFLPEGLGAVPLTMGVISAVLAAAMRAYPPAVLRACFVLAGAAVGGVALAGHTGLPLALHAGVLYGASVAVALPAALVSASRRAVAAGWPVLGWRVAASWLGAVAMMLAAVRLT